MHIRFHIFCCRIRVTPFSEKWRERIAFPLDIFLVKLTGWGNELMLLYNNKTSKSLGPLKPFSRHRALTLYLFERLVPCPRKRQTHFYFVGLSLSNMLGTFINQSSNLFFHFIYFWEYLNE